MKDWNENKADESKGDMLEGMKCDILWVTTQACYAKPFRQISCNAEKMMSGAESK